MTKYEIVEVDVSFPFDGTLYKDVHDNKWYKVAAKDKNWSSLGRYTTKTAAKEMIKELHTIEKRLHEGDKNKHATSV